MPSGTGKAERIRHKAETVHDETIRQQLLTIAQEYDALTITTDIH
jgi:hypothetical protein